MCGIVGLWSPQQKINKEILLKMRDILRHRGPDDAGIFIDKISNLGLAHRRLSIIDLSEKAHQPMPSGDGNLWITYNGEVYNFREIRKELENKGYKFQSNSDTEVVLKSFQEWGKDCLEKFRGMFSFAIWDKRNQKLYLFRDRLGIKPLFYYSTPKTFIFASELKSILGFPEFKKDIDFEALSYYLQLGYIPAPYTIFKNTFKLEPGSILEINEQLNLKKTKYWEPKLYFLKDKIQKSEEEIIGELEELLKESFQYRLVSDVEVGIFLSGGIDSSLLTTLLQKNSSQKLKTFTIGFEEKAYNEAPFAEKVAKILGTDHHQYYLNSEDLRKIFLDFVEIYDEPFGDSAGLPTYLLSRFTSEKVKVVLSADGGDELFWGYSKYKVLNELKNTPYLFRLLGEKFLRTLSPPKAEKIYSLFSKIFSLPKYSNLREKISKLTNLLKGKNFPEIFQLASSYWIHSEVKNLIGDKTISTLNRFFQEININHQEQMQLWDILTYLPDDILVKTDRATMSWSLEGREPYLDQKIVEYTATIPPKLKFKNNQQKYILKKILFKHLPKELFSRPKTGFRLPIYEWFKKDWRENLREYLEPGKIAKQGIFQPNFIKEIMEKYNKGKYVNPDKLWILLAFQLWYQKWMG